MNHRYTVALCVLLVSCGKNPTGPGEAIRAKWRAVDESYQLRVNGDLVFTEAIVYPADIRFWRIVEISSDFLRSIVNAPCGSGYSSDYTAYTLHGSLIVTVDQDTIEFTVSPEQLSLAFVHSGIYEGNSIEERITSNLVRYEGLMPPTEWQTAISNDTYEPDQTPAEATPIGEGNLNAQDHVLVIGDSDWYAFSGTAGTNYVVETTGILDTQISLFDADATTLLAEDDDSGDFLNARVAWTAASDTTYFFLVKGYADLECGPYGIRLLIQSSQTQAASVLAPAPVSMTDRKSLLSRSRKKTCDPCLTPPPS